MKRFTDTTLWNKKWFRKLSPEEKCAWYYLKDVCDNVGVIAPDFEAAEFLIGAAVDWDKLIEHTNKNINVLKNGKWFLVDFCDFQYGELHEECKPHKSYISLLAKHGLLKGYGKGIDSVQEKEKEKDKEKDKDKNHGDFVKLQPSAYDILCYQYGKIAVDDKIDSINNWIPNHKPYKDYAAAIRTWFKRDGVTPKPKPKLCPNGHLYTGDVCERCI